MQLYSVIQVSSVYYELCSHIKLIFSILKVCYFGHKVCIKNATPPPPPTPPPVATVMLSVTVSTKYAPHKIIFCLHEEYEHKAFGENIKI